MKRILKIGMDVHSTNYTLCAMEPVIGAEDRVFANVQVTPDYKNIILFIENLKQKLGLNDTYDIECGYEAGCLGYSLYNQLTAAGVKCVILAPTTMLTEQGQRIKTDSRDAHLIAQCLSYGGYHPVYIPTEQDDSVKEYLRMRDDHKKALKKIKQQIGMFCIRHGYCYEGTKWTIAHLKWLKKLEAKDEEAVKYAETFKQISLEHTHGVMKRLGISTDYELGESFFAEPGFSVVLTRCSHVSQVRDTAGCPLLHPMPRTTRRYAAVRR